jgi:hypothetical protein
MKPITFKSIRARDIYLSQCVEMWEEMRSAKEW